MKEMIEIDGSQGGGQILRTALSLALITGRPFKIKEIRAGRKKPGLMRQHLTCVQAAAQVSDSQVTGAELGSKELTFVPGSVKAGNYSFAIGSAGSVGLVFQTILLPLALVDGTSRLEIEGGTHNSMAPTCDFLRESFLPELESLGFHVSLTLERYGFYPAGGGKIVVVIKPRTLTAGKQVLSGRSEVINLAVEALSAHVPSRVGEAEISLVKESLGIQPNRAETKQVSSAGPGNMIWATVETRRRKAVFSAFGARGLPLEQVAADLVRQVRRFMDSGAEIEEHLQDQLLLPLALCGGGSYSTMGISEHTRTNAAIIQLFLSVTIQWSERSTDWWEIEIKENKEGI